MSSIPISQNACVAIQMVTLLLALLHVVVVIIIIIIIIAIIIIIIILFKVKPSQNLNPTFVLTNNVLLLLLFKS